MKQLKGLVIGILVSAMLVGGSVTVFADTETTDQPLTNDVPQITNNDLEAIESYDLVPQEMPGRKVTIGGGFHGDWGTTNSTSEVAPGKVGGIYGRVIEPDGTTWGWYAGIWEEGLDGGYIHGKYAGGYFWGNWLCVETGVGGQLKGEYSSYCDTSTDRIGTFKGEWASSDGSIQGYLRGTWAPHIQVQIGGRFAGQYTNNDDATAAEISPDGRLYGRYRAFRLADGTLMALFKGRWNPNNRAAGSLVGLVVNGDFYGLWNCDNSNAKGYLKGDWENNQFKGSWGHMGNLSQGRLWGRYGILRPVEKADPEPVTPDPQRLEQQTGTTQQLSIEAKPMVMQKTAVASQIGKES